MDRTPTTQDVSRFLDQWEKDQLNLDPHYQRRSVWSLTDRRFFIDTILNGYPSPPIFLHKTIDDEGHPTYHVVDGKQRPQTIIDFTKDKIRIPDDFSDVNLQRKRWSDLSRETKVTFWNYTLTVEILPDVSDAMIRSTFDRINRNSRKLTPQELRHAKYDGWFIGYVEKESELEEWKRLGVVTAARAKRMADVQFISELCAIVLNGRISGFDQNMSDDLYAEYEDVSALAGFSEEEFAREVDRIKAVISQLILIEPELFQFLKTQSHFYSLWAFIHLNPKFCPTKNSAERYRRFLFSVNDALKATASAAELEALELDDRRVIAYSMHSRGATTDLKPRKMRLQALGSVIGE